MEVGRNELLDRLESERIRKRGSLDYYRCRGSDSLKTFYKRKIRNGRIKLLHRWWIPDERHMKYDGRLDGLWYWFAIYRDYKTPDGIEDFIYMWGSDKYKQATENIENEEDWPEITEPHIIDRVINWMWWRLKE